MTDIELSIISKDTAFYSSEERLLALYELEKRGGLSGEQAVAKGFIEESMVAMPDSVSIRRVYKMWAIWTGSIIGGPLAAGYMIAENFKAFDEDEARIKRTWIYTILATIALLCGVAFISEEFLNKIPGLTMPLIYTVVIRMIANHFQGRSIQSHLAGGGRKFSWGRVVVIGVIGAIVTAVACYLILIGLSIIAYYS